MSERLRELPTIWLNNYVAAFESGRVQKHPQARFVNARGECCAVAAFAGAATVADFVVSPLWRLFLGGSLETISRDFEARRVTPQELYETILLELAARAGAEAARETTELVTTV